jgi:hypothetical protein
MVKRNSYNRNFKIMGNDKDKDKDKGIGHRNQMKILYFFIDRDLVIFDKRE